MSEELTLSDQDKKMAVIIANADICKTLTPKHRDAIEASLFPKLSTMSAGETKALCVALITTAYQMIGQRAPGNDEKEVKDGIRSMAVLLNEQMKYFSTYSAKELITAVRMGCAGETIDRKDLDIPVVSPANIHKMIYAYNDKIRKEAKHLQSKHEDKLTAEQEEEKRQKGIRQMEDEINQAYELYCEDESFIEQILPGLRSTYYQYLDRRTRLATGSEWDRVKKKWIGGSSVVPEVEIKKSIWAKAENEFASFEDLSDEEKHIYRGKLARQEFEKTRNDNMIQFSYIHSLKAVFDRYKEAGAKVIITH